MLQLAGAALLVVAALVAAPASRAQPSGAELDMLAPPLGGAVAIVVASSAYYCTHERWPPTVFELKAFVETQWPDAAPELREFDWIAHADSKLVPTRNGDLAIQMAAVSHALDVPVDVELPPPGCDPVTGEIAVRKVKLKARDEAEAE